MESEAFPPWAYRVCYRTEVRRAVGISEVFGLKPLPAALRQSWQGIVGDGLSPPSQWDLSSVAMFRPRKISLPLWLGRERSDGRVWVYNLFNRNPIPRDQGYSVRISTCRDFRGGQLTYDGHVGTDFACPVGTEVSTVAPGIVRSVQKEMQRGGLKVIIDHGRGLISTSNHLARALVSTGDEVHRGQVVGLSGMSSVDGILFFPWLAPHLHLNILLDGEPVDPFAMDSAMDNEVSLWLSRNDPTPPPRSEPESPLAEESAMIPTKWDSEAVEASIRSCLDTSLQRELREHSPLDERACAVAVARLFRWHAFGSHPPLVSQPNPRRPALDLPFRDHVGIAFADRD